jgi:hypothetical protein
LRPSTTIRKISGNKGHPYLRPLEGKKKLDVDPLIKTTKYIGVVGAEWVIMEPKGTP